MAEVNPIAEANPVDSVLVSAVVYLLGDESVPAAAETVAQRVTVRADGTVAVILGSFTVETNDNTERQNRLASALGELWATFVGAGFWPSHTAKQVDVVLSISLSPAWGQAGISISPESLQQWLEAGAYLHVNAYSQM